MCSLSGSIPPSAFSGNHQACSTPSPPVPSLCKQPVVPVLPTLLLCCHCLPTQGCGDQGAQPALCLCSLGCHWWEHIPSQGQWWGARVSLVPSHSWPLGLHDLLCTSSWDAISGICNCCRSPIPGWHPQPSIHLLRKAPLVPTARSAPRVSPCHLWPYHRADPLKAHCEQHWTSPWLGGRCHTGAWFCCLLCQAWARRKPTHAFSILRQFQICKDRFWRPLSSLSTLIWVFSKIDEPHGTLQKSPSPEAGGVGSEGADLVVLDRGAQHHC